MRTNMNEYSESSLVELSPPSNSSNRSATSTRTDSTKDSVITEPLAEKRHLMLS